MPLFEFLDCLPIVTAADEAGLDVVLVGGQAVSFYAARFLTICPELRAFQPFLSKDVDLLGTMDDGYRLAAAIGVSWEPNPRKGGMQGLCLGRLTLPAPSHAKVELLGRILGADSASVRANAYRVEVHGSGKISVINPFLLYCVKGNNAVQIAQNDPGHERQDARQFMVMSFVVRAILQQFSAEDQTSSARSLVKTCGRLLEFWLSRDGATLVAAGVARPEQVLPTDAMRTHPHESVGNLLDKRLPVFFEQQLPRAVASAVPRMVEKVRADFRPFIDP